MRTMTRDPDAKMQHEHDRSMWARCYQAVWRQAARKAMGDDYACSWFPQTEPPRP